MPQGTSNVAVLLIAHGSRRQEANADLDLVAEALRARGRFAIVECSYLEIAEPTIPQGAARCVERGATTVLLLPYFLSAGSHVTRDLEGYRADFEIAYPAVDFRLCAPLGVHPKMLEIIDDRIDERLDEV
ncbi:MAG: cobalamin biosynthesis protein CbiX [Planctomycetota bacterium]|nr:cobalamin biosynthesis protein CbiX [Planctomycetota bacterium]